MAVIPEFFGLNLGHHSVKIVQTVNDKQGNIQLQSMGSIPTAYGLLENDSEGGIKKLSEEIKRAALTTKVTTKNCVLSIPEVSVFSRLITLPTVKEEETSEAVQWALKPLVPVPLENLNISYLDINETTIEGNSFTNWYVVAAPKDLIQKFQTAVTGAGMELLAVETEALAITRLVAYNYPDLKESDLMIVDFGAENTNVILSRNGIVMFSQTIGTGSNALTKVISSDLGIDLVQAENYKLTYGLDKTALAGKVYAASEPVMQIITGEISRTLTYYREKIGSNGLNNIFLTGGGSDLKNLAMYIKEKVGINAEIVNPLNKIGKGNFTQEELSKLHVATFNVSIGLSIKGVL